MDRRAIKTRKAIFEGLAELMAEKELRKITVQELSDKVDIHRVTFYKHFMDIYDVYEQLEKHILREIGLLITEHGEKPSDELYHAVLQYVADNPSFFRMIFSPHNTGMLYHKLLKMFVGLKSLIWTELFGVDFSDSAAESVIRYHANGCFAVISQWVNSGFTQPLDDVINTLSELEKRVQDFLTGK